MLRFALAAALAFGMTSAAFAQGLTATLATPVAKPTQVQTEDSVWSCNDKACVGKIVGEEANSWTECRKFAQKVGKVVAYGTLNENQLAMCNAGMK